MPRGVYQRTKKQAAESIKVNEPMLISLTLPFRGLTLKLRSHGGVIGTFRFEAEGIRFSKANAKKVPEKVLTYAVLNRLAEIGIG